MQGPLSCVQAISAAMSTLRDAVADDIEVGAYGNGFCRTTSEWMSRSGASSSSELENPAGNQPLAPATRAAAPSNANTHACCADDYNDCGVITPEAYLRHAQGWVRAGATIVGGCCAVGPDHIKVLARALKNA